MTEAGAQASSNRVVLRLLARLLLYATVLTASLATAEILLRFFYPQVTLSQYPQRYRIDGRPSFATGYFSADPILPVALHRRWSHTVADVAWAPTPFHVQLDEHGYRNDVGSASGASVVVVGDSTVFGFGVQGNETIPAQLSRLINVGVYNLGIPGAGPEGYMVMIERHLRSARPPALVVLVVSTSNDFANLENSLWDELATCQPPVSKIYRQDTPPGAAVYPVWVLNSSLKSSHLVNFLVRLAASGRRSSLRDLVLAHRAHRSGPFRPYGLYDPLRRSSRTESVRLWSMPGSSAWLDVSPRPNATCSAST